MHTDSLQPTTAEAVLARLGFAAPPATDREGLEAVYRAWCLNVPFDNVVKRIHLAAGDPSPFPNTEPEAFFALWLRHGVGGTCWPTAGALHALLVALGFEATRGSAAMRDDLVGPVHGHGTTLVRVEEDRFWVDSSMLSNRPLLLVAGEETALADPLHPMRAEPVDERWRIWWQSPPLDEPIGCLLLDEDVSLDHYRARYEVSREVSPFNAALYARRNRADRVLAVARGHLFERTAAGSEGRPAGAGLTGYLVEELGYSEEIVASLPPDDAPVEVPR